MTPPKYNIVFSGKTVDGTSLDTARKKLSVLFRTDLSRIEALFSKQGKIIKKEVDHETALKFAGLIRSAGALVDIELVHSSEDELSLSFPHVQEKVREETEQKDLPVRVELLFGPSSLAYSPLPCNRVTLSPRGININRNDLQEIFFSDFRMISVVKQTRGPLEEYRLVFFLRNRQRPFLAEARSIQYSEFPIEKNVKSIEALRNFLKYLFIKCSHAATDSNTYAFVYENRSDVFDKDLNVFTSAMASALEKLPEIRVAGPDYDSLTETVSEGKKDPVQSSQQDKKAKAQRSLGILMRRYSLGTNAYLELTEQQIDLRIKQAAFIAAFMIFVGSILPLMKYNASSEVSVLLWPWHLLGLGLEETLLAVSGSFAKKISTFFWILTPLAAGILFLLAGWVMSFTPRSLCIAAAGLVSLSVVSAVLFETARITGLAIVSQSIKSGILIVFFVLSAGTLASSNHLQKIFPSYSQLRIVTAAAGVVMVNVSVLIFFTSYGPWKSWPALTLFAGAGTYGIIGIVSAIQPYPKDRLLSLTSLSGRLLAAAVPVASILMQKYLPNVYYPITVHKGTILFYSILATVKLVLIYGGCVLGLAAGIFGILFRFLVKPVNS